MVESKTDNRQRLIAFARLAVGVILIASALLWNGNGRKILELLARIPLAYVAALLVLSLAMNWVSSLKWQLIVNARGANVALLRLTGFYLIGKFFSNFAPSMVGGDLSRIVLLAREIDSGRRATVTVLLERLTGIVTVVALSVVAAGIDARALRHPLFASMLIVAGAACIVALSMIASAGIQGSLVAVLQRIPGLRVLASALESFQAELAFYSGRYRLLAGTLLYSLLFYALASVSVYLSAQAVGIQVPYASIALVTPILFLVTALPVSPNNIGWWEWCFGLVLLDTGARLEQGVAVALTMRVVTLVVSFLGGFLLLTKLNPWSRSRA